MPVLDGVMSQSLTRRAMVDQLNALTIKAPRGGLGHLGKHNRWLRLSDRLSLHLNLTCYPKVEEFSIKEAG